MDGKQSYGEFCRTKKAMTKTRLAQLCTVFGWKGGTIHQAHEKIEFILSKRVDIMKLSDQEFGELLDTLETNLDDTSYKPPKWIAEDEFDLGLH